MKSKLNILMVFPEIAPFSKTGDLGEMAGFLPKALKDLGHDIRVITPQYRTINERKYILRDVIRLQNIDVKSCGTIVQINVKSAFLPNSKVQVYFIDYKPYFFREGMYNNPKSGEFYADNDRRFILFARGVLETLTKLQWQPDIIHCHDWQCGLIPLFLKTVNRSDPFFEKTFSVFTIHNFANRGNFNDRCLVELGANGDAKDLLQDIEWNGRCSFLKAGIVHADAVNTVSEQYAREVRASSDVSYGMNEWVRLRKDGFPGITHGIDYTIWNPESDPLISEIYSIQDVSGKLANKKSMLERFSLDFSELIPVVSMISPLTDQKGLGLIKDAFEDMMNLNLSFLLLGTGDRAFQTFFESMKKKYPRRVAVHPNGDPSLSHHIMAGADIVLVPSKIEPCGLTQLYGMKYGTVPVVRQTGGLMDTVRPFDAQTGKGTGFVFQEMQAKAFLKTLKQAVKAFEDRKTWLRIMKNGMREDFSSHASAKKYIQLYNRCLLKKK